MIVVVVVKSNADRENGAELAAAVVDAVAGRIKGVMSRLVKMVVVR